MSKRTFHTIRLQDGTLCNLDKRFSRRDVSLAMGDFDNLDPSQRANLAEASSAQQDSAADDLPYVAYYANDAALSSIDLYIDMPSDTAQNRQARAMDALKYAHQAVNDDPYSLSYVQTLGGIEYYLAPSGSLQEKSGISLMNKAIIMTPEAIAWYGNAAQIAALKKDYPMARSFVARGLKAAHTPKDRTTLDKIAAALPAS